MGAKVKWYVKNHGVEKVNVLFMNCQSLELTYILIECNTFHALL